MTEHQSLLEPSQNKFHVGNREDGSAGKGTGRHIGCWVFDSLPASPVILL